MPLIFVMAVSTGNNKLQAACEAFEVVDSDGNLRMSVTEKDITVGVDDMKYLGKNLFLFGGGMGGGAFGRWGQPISGG